MAATTAAAKSSALNRLVLLTLIIGRCQHVIAADSLCVYVFMFMLFSLSAVLIYCTTRTISSHRSDTH